ncbi:hypothetical protein PA598K_03959 [Paenibacillus sp. 598K]|nr:hypothetical protein PA598K_03959 [Paenibacillus sp. 598K]
MLRPGRRVGRAAPLMPWLLTAGALWSLTGAVPFGALLGMAPTATINRLLGHPVTVGVAVLLLLVAISTTGTLYSRAMEQFGQTRVAGRLAALSVTGGLAAGAGALLLWMLTSDPSRPFDLEAIATSPTIPRELGAVVGACLALWAAITLLRLPGSIAHARQRQADIARLRVEGLSYAGTLTAVTFTHSWMRNDPLFKVEVSYTFDGAPRVVSAHMRTSAERVPLVGSRMIVLTDGRGVTHVELDLASGATFEPNVEKYAPSE